MPLIAVTVLRATPGQVGLLAALGTVAFPVVGLPAGAWTDRVRRRGVLIAADVARAVVLCSVPVAWWLGVLHIGQLYAVVLLCGIGTVFFDVASQSYVPRVVPAPTDTRLWRDMTEGVTFVVRHRVLRVVVLSGALVNLGIVLIVTILPVVLADEPAVLGLFLASGGVGTLIGSLLARLVGAGRLVLVGAFVAAPCGFGMPNVAEGRWLAGAGWVVVTAVMGMNNVVLVSFRQAVTPDRLLGRMTASFRFLLMGALAVGASVSGVLGEAASPRVAMVAGATAIALVWVPILASPLRKVRDLDG